MAEQTVVCEHLVAVDEFGAGPARVRNTLVGRTDSEWLVFLDDDDLLDNDCVEVLLQHATPRDDVVYPFCRVEGKDDWCPNRLFHPDALLRSNYIPVTALVRREAFLAVGGFRPVDLEDWDLWKRMLGNGAIFKCVDEVTWTYRVLVSGESRNQWTAVAA